MTFLNLKVWKPLYGLTLSPVKRDHQCLVKNWWKVVLWWQDPSISKSLFINVMCLSHGYMYVFYNPLFFLLSKFHNTDDFMWENLVLLKHIYIFRRYSTMNATAVLGLFTPIWIKWRRGWCFSILVIFFAVTIFYGLMKWPLLLYTIIIGGPGSFLWTPI